VACGANAVKKADGTCACAAGFTNYNGICSKCPQGALWSSSANKCVYVCGQNSLYSTAASACVCNPGFGLLNNVCQQCPLNYFISNNYCVTCPLNAAYNSATKNCECASGFFTNQFGLCTRKCGTNEVYDSSIQDCNCIKGLGRINGACQVCPAGSTPAADGSGCSNCKANEVLVNGQCLCQQGYAFNSGRVCTICSNIPNGFLVNGICSVCPGNTIYDGVSKCRCPAGKTAQGSRCISQCQADELLDDKGNCYTCGSNQVIFGGKCVCASGYSLNDCGVCTLGCSGNQFAFRGACATCPLNTVYNAAINGCACPQGFYMNTYGICEKLILVPITCPDGQYFDSNNGCQACTASCKTCNNANTCLTCSTRGYSANSAGNCVPTCGDGLLVGTEACDTGSTYSAGCSSCQITAGWTCSGQPSVCKNNLPSPAAPISNNNTTPAIGPTPTLPTAPVDTSAAPLYQSGSTNINSNNVFVTLKTSQTFTFANPT
jgi:proprotein convertase subtilisin/kexin type 5